jgi:hypothetical protein
MERSKAKETGRRKYIRETANALKDKPPQKAPPKETIKQAGRYHAIETAKKQLSEAQQAIVPEQDQQPYTAVDKVEDYAGSIVNATIYQTNFPPLRQHGNVSHRETHSRNSQAAKAVTPKERMRWQAVKEARKDKPEAAKHGPQNVSHSETHLEATQPVQTPKPKERMRRQMVQEVKQKKAEESREQINNMSHGETSFEITEHPPEPPKKRMRQSYLKDQRRKHDTAHCSDKPISDRADNDLLPDQNRSTSVLQEQANNTSQYHSTRKDRKQITGQCQRTLPRDTSLVGTLKAQIVKEQGRRYARDQTIKQIKTGSAKGAVKAGNEIIEKLGAALSRAVRPSSDDLMMYGGFALIMIVPLVMLAGIAVALFGSGEGRSTYVPVSAEVEAYTPIIQIYANQYGIPEYTELIKAVMMQESGGQGSDPMQCSECGFNTRYPHCPGGITDPEYSIDVGIQNLADCLRLSGVESPIDLDGISLALQGYNYGSGYISWALANYGGYSELNAIEFSEMMAARSGASGYGDRAYVSHVLRYYPIGRTFMGEGNSAIVAVAQSQIGNEGGLKYCEWYGYPYRVEWCAIFVSWCADQCGYLDAEVLPKMMGVRPYVDWFRERGQWQGRDYEPSPGDIIFYDWEGDGLADHVGIVEKAENSTVYSVEGNAGDRCVENSHMIGAAPIYGFGLPQY